MNCCMTQLTEIILKGTERIEELSEEWHREHVPSGGGKRYKSIMQFQNPLDSTDPVISEVWPIPEDYLSSQPGETREVEETFFIYEGGVYILVQVPDQRSGEYTAYLKGCTKDSRPLIRDGEGIEVPDKYKNLVN